MNIRSRLQDSLTDLLAAKKAFGQHRLINGVSSGGLNWHPQMRVAKLSHRTGNNLHAIGVGRKMVDGKLTNIPCVRLYVSQKLPHRLVETSNRLPSLIDGILTDVVEATPAHFAAPSKCTLRKLKEQRPAQGGISGAHKGIQAGTLGARCRSRKPEEQADRFVLGNCHSFADFGHAITGSEILQPSIRDGGLVDANLLARLHRSIPIVEGELASNHLDAAIGKLLTIESMQPGVCTLGSISGTTTANFEEKIHKHGRTTGYTSGVIDDPSVDVLIPLQRDDPTRVAHFVDQVRIRPSLGQFVFAQPGDSGALVLTKPENKAVGLLFACPDNGSYAYANPINTVLDALEIDLE